MTDDSHLTTLRTEVAELVRLIDLVRAEITQPARRDIENHAKMKISDSSPDWNADAAHLVFEVEAGARDHEAKLARIAYRGVPQRGTSSAGAIGALVHLPDLIMLVAGKYPDRKAPHHAELDISQWCRRARIMLDRAIAGDERPTPALNIPCPQCGRTLFLPVGWMYETHQTVFCKWCVDDNGRRLTWPASTWLAVVLRGESA